VPWVESGQLKLKEKTDKGRRLVRTIWLAMSVALLGCVAVCDAESKRSP
jgi:hypothetical protein